MITCFGGPTRSFGEQGKMTIYFQGAGEHALDFGKLGSTIRT